MGEVVCGDTVALEENEVHVVSGHFQLSADSVLNSYGLACLLTSETEHPLLALGDICLYLVYRKVTALCILTVNSGIFLVSGLLLADNLYLLGSHKAGISKSPLGEELCENMVYLLALTLSVGTVAAVVAISSSALVKVNAEVVHSVDDCLNSTLHLTLVVGILYSEVENTIRLVSDTLADNSVIEVAEVNEARGTGSYTGNAGALGELSFGETSVDILGSFLDIGEKKFCKCLKIHIINPSVIYEPVKDTGNIYLIIPHSAAKVND